MNTQQELVYLVNAIDQLKKEPSTADLLERIRTLELCLFIAARKLSTEVVP